MDGNAFERQLANVLQEAAGPPRPTDVTAVVHTVASPRPSLLPGVIGPLRLLVAAGVVALIAGSLLLALLGSLDGSQRVPGASSSTSPTPDWRATVRTELQAPGIEQVIDDGTAHVFVGQTGAALAGRDFDEVAVGPDGEVWLHAPDGTLIHLGQDGQLRTSSRGLTGIGFLAFDGDGSLYTSLGGDHAVVQVRGVAGSATEPSFVEVDPNHPAAPWLNGEGFHPPPDSMSSPAPSAGGQTWVSTSGNSGSPSSVTRGLRDAWS